MIHKIKVDKTNIYADKLRIGYHFEADGGYYVNLCGAICKGFPDKNRAMLWISYYAEKYVSQVRKWLLSQKPINHNFKYFKKIL